MDNSVVAKDSKFERLDPLLEEQAVGIIDEFLPKMQLIFHVRNMSDPFIDVDSTSWYDISKNTIFLFPEDEPFDLVVKEELSHAVHAHANPRVYTSLNGCGGRFEDLSALYRKIMKRDRNTIGLKSLELTMLQSYLNMTKLRTLVECVASLGLLCVTESEESTNVLWTKMEIINEEYQRTMKRYEENPFRLIELDGYGQAYEFLLQKRDHIQDYVPLLPALARARSWKKFLKITEDI